MSGGHTPGPWAWFGNAGSNSLYLATTHSGRLYVMGFKRWGFSGAQPQFRCSDRLVDASKLVTFQVGDRDVLGVEAAKANSSIYRLDIDGIDCADARLIAAAPELLEALEGLTGILATAESNASGNPEWEYVSAKVNAARAAIAKAQREN